jgi:DNA-binding NarL/FixJ family response regulator
MKILVIERYPLIRQGLTFILKKNIDKSNVTELSSISETKDIKPGEFDLILMDPEKEPIFAFNFIERIKSEDPKVKVIVLGSERYTLDNDIVNKTIDGYISKNSGSDEIWHGINNVLKGMKYFDNNSVKSGDEFNLLSSREKEVLRYLLLGNTNPQIAGEIFVAEITVKKHVSNILLKLNLKSRTELILYVKEKFNNKIA